VDSILSFVQARESEIVALIRQFVECESPSDDPAAVNRFVDLVSDTVAPFARVKILPGGKFGKLLVCEMDLPGRAKSGQALALGRIMVVPSRAESLPYVVLEAAAGGKPDQTPPEAISQTAAQVVDVAMHALRSRSRPTTTSSSRNS